MAAGIEQHPVFVTSEHSGNTYFSFIKKTRMLDTKQVSRSMSGIFHKRFDIFWIFFILLKNYINSNFKDGIYDFLIVDYLTNIKASLVTQKRRPDT